jgi:molybdopterin molybdotransferase
LADLLSVKAAQERILEKIQPLEIEQQSLLRAFDRVLALPIYAERDAPPFTNSSMDGYAVRSTDLIQASPINPVHLKVVEDIPAGSIPQIAIQPGQASRIMTGAVLPADADAVIPVEDISSTSGSANNLPDSIILTTPVQKGQYVRPRGLDYQAGHPILQPGTRLTPQSVGMLASLGLNSVPVYRKPRVGIFSSGNELAAPGSPLAPGQIYDANKFFLSGMLTGVGAEVIHLGTARDDPVSITGLLSKAVEEQVDLIVTSAGVSVGVYDFVRQVIEENGNLAFWKVNMRPGKPLAFGDFRGIPLVGLPGNPVSAFVGCVVFVIPAIRQFIGLPPLARQTLHVMLAEAVESDGRESYLRADIRRIDGELRAFFPSHQGSGNVFSLVSSNALLIVPSGVKSLPAGSKAKAWFIGGELL